METREIEWTGSPVLRGSLPISLEGLYHEYAFEEIERKPGFYYGSVEEWASTTVRVANRGRELVRSLRDGALAIQEWEFLEKMMVCWRVKGYGSLVAEHPIINDNKEQAVWLAPELKKIGRLIVGKISDTPSTQLKATYLSTAVPIAKGKGSPYWFSATDRKVVIPLVRIAMDGKNLDEVEKELLDAGHAKMPVTLVSYLRLQAARKEREIFSLSGGRLIGAGQRVMPKARRVQAMPSSFNMLLFGIANVMKEAYRATNPNVNGTINPAVRLCQSVKTCIATDLSAMDESISFESIRDWNRYVHEPVLEALVRKGIITPAHAKKAMEVVERAQTMMILCPPPSTSEVARLVETRGTNKSGIVYTSLIATMINEARCRAKGRDLQVKVGIVNFGDDTVIGSDAPRFTERWMDPDFDNRGFTEGVAPDVSFLMRRIPEGYNFFGRMLLSTINREARYEPAGPFAAAAGIAVRTALLRGHPLEGEFGDTLAVGNERLRDMVNMSKLPVELLLTEHVRTAVKRAVSATEVDEITETIEGAAQAGIIDQKAGEQLKDALAPYNDKAYQTWGQLLTDANMMPPRVARKIINRASYTQR